MSIDISKTILQACNHFHKNLLTTCTYRNTIINEFCENAFIGKGE